MWFVGIILVVVYLLEVYDHVGIVYVIYVMVQYVFVYCWQVAY